MRDPGEDQAERRAVRLLGDSLNRQRTVWARRRGHRGIDLQVKHRGNPSEYAGVRDLRQKLRGSLEVSAFEKPPRQRVNVAVQRVVDHRKPSFRSQTSRSPSRVRNGSTVSIVSACGAISSARPPVAITGAVSPISARMRLTMPSTWPAKP